MIDIIQAPPKKTFPHWKGTFELYQEERFAKIVAKHYRLEVLNLGGLLVLARKNPILGYTQAVIGSPEIKVPLSKILSLIEPFKFAQVDIHSTQLDPALEPHLVSPKDNMNMVIDLTVGEKVLFDGFKRKDKASAIRAEKRGLVIRDVKGTQDEKEFQRILNDQSAGGKKFDVSSLAYLQELREVGYAKSIVAVYEKKIVGGIFIVLASDKMFGWHSSYLREYRKLEIARSLCYSCLRWGIANDFKCFDFGQQSLGKVPSLVAFKQTFRPILIPAYSYRIRRNDLRALFLH